MEEGARRLKTQDSRLGQDSLPPLSSPEREKGVCDRVGGLLIVTFPADTIIITSGYAESSGKVHVAVKYSVQLPHVPREARLGGIPSIGP